MRRPTRWLRPALAVLAVIAGVLIPAGPAAATVTCTFNGGTGLMRLVWERGDSVTVARSGDSITVNGGDCGGATVTTTDRIDAAPTETGGELVIDLAGGPFEPGLTAEASGQSEIEFTGDLYSAPLTIIGSEGRDHIVFGSAGMNLNADESSPDADVTLLRVTEYRIFGNGGNDVIRGDGGIGTGVGTISPVKAMIDGGDGDDEVAGTKLSDELIGGPGIDTVDYVANTTWSRISLKLGTATTSVGFDSLAGFENVDGSPAMDIIEGSNGPNVLRGFDADDTLSGLGGDDVIVCGKGDDEVDFTKARGKITVNLAKGFSRGEGTDVVLGCEDVQGSRFGDRITGTNKGNEVDGAGGADVINTGGGSDIIQGGDGDDTIRAGAGDDFVYAGNGDDWIDGGPGYDSCPTSPGHDTRRNCEIP